jgi:hypothetical protein
MRAERVLVALLLLATPLAAQDLDARTRAFLNKHCSECHDADTKKGNLDLGTLTGDLSTRPLMDRWTSIVDRVAAGEMPPVKKARPTAEELQAFTAWIRPRLSAADRTRRSVVQRRLNRVEYENTVRDLLGIDIELKQYLPEDQRAGGFDNNGEALAVSSELLGSYLEAAERALSAAIVHGPQPASVTLTADAEKDVSNYLKSYSILDHRVFIYQSEEGGYSKISSRAKRMPIRGLYHISFEAVTRNSDKPITFSVNVSDFAPISAISRTLGYYEATGEVKKFEIDAVLDKAMAVQFFAHTLPHWVHNEPALGTFPGIGWGAVTVTGPIHPVWPPGSHTRLLGDVDLAKGTMEDAEKILRRFMPRAFRRPVTDVEVERYMTLVRSRKDAGRGFEQCLRAGLNGVLCSPNFLYLREDVRPGGRINDFELASRLSYFLWSTLPDAELSGLAAKGTLHEPGVLAAQTQRLLSDPRCRRFVEHFTDQWLGLRNIDATTPDKKLYKDFDELLKISMVNESLAFFTELLSKDLPIVNFIDSDFAMLNRRLAAHYGIAGVDTLEIQPVKLPEGCLRGGVLTQGAVLKVTANGTNTSPVIRGVWVLENILGRHIPPPPPNITGIEPDIRGAVTIREQLQKHRDVPSCNVCHQFIDPPGFALESFDPTGRYRKNYAKWVPHPENVEWGRLADGAVVDPAGKTSTGQPFSGIADFKKLLLEHQKAFAHCLAEKLMTYGLGREMGYSDRDEIDAVVAKAAAGGNGLRTLIVSIVQNPLFSRR